LIYLKDNDGNKKLTVVLIIAGIILGGVIFALFGWIYLRKREHDAPLLSTEAYTQVA